MKMPGHTKIYYGNRPPCLLHMLHRPRRTPCNLETPRSTRELVWRALRTLYAAFLSQYQPHRHGHHFEHGVYKMPTENARKSLKLTCSSTEVRELIFQDFIRIEHWQKDQNNIPGRFGYPPIPFYFSKRGWSGAGVGVGILRGIPRY